MRPITGWVIYILISFGSIIPLGRLVFPIGVKVLWCIRVQRHLGAGSKPLVLQKRKLRSGEITWVGDRATIHLEEIPLSYTCQECVKKHKESHTSVYLDSLLHLCSKLGRQLANSL